MKYLYIFLFVVVAVLAAVFSSQNTVPVTVSFFSWSASGPLSLVLVVTLAVGMGLGLLITLPAMVSGNVKHSFTKSKLRRLEKTSGKNGLPGEATMPASGNSSSESPAKPID